MQTTFGVKCFQMTILKCTYNINHTYINQLYQPSKSVKMSKDCFTVQACIKPPSAHVSTNKYLSLCEIPYYHHLIFSVSLRQLIQYQRATMAMLSYWASVTDAIQELDEHLSFGLLHFQLSPTVFRLTVDIWQKMY